MYSVHDCRVHRNFPDDDTAHISVGCEFSAKYGARKTFDLPVKKSKTVLVNIRSIYSFFVVVCVHEIEPPSNCANIHHLHCITSALSPNEKAILK